MNKFFLTAAAAVVAASAQAEVVVFTPGATVPTDGSYTVVNTFDSAAGLTGSNFQILNTSVGGVGAQPTQGDGSYLAVLGGGSATYAFAQPVSAFQFVIGSVDTYNTITYTSSLGGTRTLTGSQIVAAADGNQVLDRTNGTVTIRGAAGETFSNVTFGSTGNSLEVDTLAVSAAVPEPATWGMLILGFGVAGGAMRRRRAVAFA